MQIQAINGYKSDNTSFNANLEIIGKKKLLHNADIKKLYSKAKTIGTDSDTIYISLLAHPKTKTRTYYDFFGNGRTIHDITDWATLIQGSHVLPSINNNAHVDYQKMIPYIPKRQTFLGYLLKPDRSRNYQAISEYLDIIKEKFNLISTKN